MPAQAGTETASKHVGLPCSVKAPSSAASGRAQTLRDMSSAEPVSDSLFFFTIAIVQKQMTYEYNMAYSIPHPDPV